MFSRFFTFRALFSAGILAAGAAVGPASAEGSLVMYCGVQEEWCRAMATTFEKETGIKFR